MSSYHKTPKAQRIGIWVIAIMMLVFTIAGFASMILGAVDPKTDPNTVANDKVNQQYEEYMKQYKKQQEEAQKKKRIFSDDYKDRVASFNADDVKDLAVETLKGGDGATVSKGDTVKVNYTGWMPNGTIFDSTKSEGSDATPTEFKLEDGSLISGWVEGLEGKRAGGIYLLSIPSDKAYGESGNGTIPANTPLKFIIEVTSVTKK